MTAEAAPDPIVAGRYLARRCLLLPEAAIQTLVVKTSRKSSPATLVIGDNGWIGTVRSVRFYPLDSGSAAQCPDLGDWTQSLQSAAEEASFRLPELGYWTTQIAPNIKYPHGGEPSKSKGRKPFDPRPLRRLITVALGSNDSLATACSEADHTKAGNQHRPGGGLGHATSRGIRSEAVVRASFEVCGVEATA